MTALQRRHIGANGERGFTLVELLVATVVSMLVLGGAVTLTSQIQNGYRRQVEAAAAEQEGRYALEWIGKLLRGAGNNPFSVDETNCPGGPAPLDFVPIRFDPDADDIDNDIRLQSDANPPDGFVGGVGGAGGPCDQANEDVTISYDPGNRAIVFFDNNLAPEASIRTDAVIEDLRFIFRNRDHSTTDASGNPIAEANVRYVETRITVRTRTIDPNTGQPVTRVVSSEVRVRGL